MDNEEFKEQAIDYLYFGMIKLEERDYAFAIEYLDSAKEIASDEDIDLQKEINEWLFKACMEFAKNERKSAFNAEEEKLYAKALDYLNSATRLLERSAKAEEIAFSSSSQSDSLMAKTTNDYIRVQHLYEEQINSRIEHDRGM